MNSSAKSIQASLEAHYIEHYPDEVASHLEKLDHPAAVALINRNPASIFAKLLTATSPATLKKLLPEIDESLLIPALVNLSPVRVANTVRLLDEQERKSVLEKLPNLLRADVDLLLSCPPGTAGAIMDPRIIFIKRGDRVSQALAKLREEQVHRRYVRSQRVLLVVDTNGKLDGIIAIQDLALADEAEIVDSYVYPAPAFVPLHAEREEIVDALTEHGLSSLPVVDDEGHLVGIVRYEELVSAVQEKASVDLQTVFGASRDEKALSAPMFAVRKRLPWLQINLLTAFLAASVVGVFETTIAAFTALAVLLPVVAGQSGNTGAQALAVVIRGLALREISAAHWPRVLVKETAVGAINGIAVALTCAIGVYLWSKSVGLSAVIAISMVISMAVAGLAGAGIPLLLNRLGQDPAQSSSIILTTVTDVAGFFSFLGIATVFLTLL